VLDHEVAAGGIDPELAQLPGVEHGDAHAGRDPLLDERGAPELVDRAVHGHGEDEEWRRVDEQRVMDVRAEYEVERGRGAERLFDELRVRSQVRGRIFCRRRIDHRPEERQVGLGEVFEVSAPGVHLSNMHYRRRDRGHADDIPVTGRRPS
jgi:hypothetical protein